MTVHVMVYSNIETSHLAGLTKLLDLLETLIRQGRWFMVEPWPCGVFRVYLHDEPGARVVLKDYGFQVEGGPDE